ncbi:MAG: histidine kinase [Proteobacteria bacterium]|nr:histidine kinase [Pseudomonadota bacterium]
MNSLRARLVLSLTAFIILAGLVTGGVTYLWAFNEANELQDSVLAQMAAVAAGGVHDKVGVGNVNLEPEARVAVEEIDTSHSSADAVGLNALPDGFHLTQRDGRNWRVLLVTRPDKTRFAVGQPADVRDEVARANALHILYPLAVLIPFLMLIVGIVIGRTLEPMARLANELDRSRTRELDPLPSEGMPSELRPFVASINRLLERVHEMVEQQRRFIADAAHELRTPIAALSVQADNLTHAKLTADAEERLTALRGGARRTAHLLDQLLALARSEVNNGDSSPPVVAADQYAKEVMADLLPLAGQRGVDLGFEVLDAVGLRADPIMVATLFRNLIDNAIRYTPQGGRVDVRLYRRDGKAVFEVEDSGPGIPSADIARVFEPFFRGSQPTGSGTGLGLSIVKRIADHLNGTVSLENKASATGLRATVTLPAASLD